MSSRPITGSGLDNATSAGERWGLDRLVAELRVSREETHSIRKDGVIHRPPSREKLAQVVSALTEALFPRHYGQYDIDGEH
ncbi:MAG: serine acetyltransferase, partial [Bradyrhizobium sp.]|nr:serine acetyltransferase [Bradyrhizobium sp.]